MLVAMEMEVGPLLTVGGLLLAAMEMETTALLKVGRLLFVATEMETTSLLTIGEGWLVVEMEMEMEGDTLTEAPAEHEKIHV